MYDNRLFPCIILILSLCGFMYSLSAGRAHNLYYRAKYIQKDAPAETVLADCERAHRLYPFNYNLCILAARKIWSERRGDAGGDELPERMDAVRKWCGRGLRLNPWRKQIRLIKTRLLRFDSAESALEYWARYVDWDFWNAFNHAVLVELQCDSGKLEEAAYSLKMVQGSPYYERAVRKIENSWKKETAPPDLDSLRKKKAAEAGITP